MPNLAKIKDRVGTVAPKVENLVKIAVHGSFPVLLSSSHLLCLSPSPLPFPSLHFPSPSLPRPFPSSSVLPFFLFPSHCLCQQCNISSFVVCLPTNLSPIAAITANCIVLYMHCCNIGSTITQRACDALCHIHVTYVRQLNKHTSTTTNVADIK